MTFDEIVQARRSVRIYDADAPFNSDVVRKSIERSILAPNSSNMQLWEFYQISTPEVKAELAKACFGQLAAKTASELVVFVTRLDKWKERADWNLSVLKKNIEGKTPGEREKRALNYYGKLMPLLYRNDFLGISTLIRFFIVAYHALVGKPIIRFITKADQRITVHKSCALAAQTFMLSMKAEGYDTCPMEGFDAVLVKKILDLPADAEINMIISCGVAKPEGIFGNRNRVPNEQVIFQR